jgi:hypothetical protein
MAQIISTVSFIDSRIPARDQQTSRLLKNPVMKIFVFVGEEKNVIETTPTISAKACVAPTPIDDVAR